MTADEDYRRIQADKPAEKIIGLDVSREEAIEIFARSAEKYRVIVESCRRARYNADRNMMGEVCAQGSLN